MRKNSLKFLYLAIGLHLAYAPMTNAQDVEMVEAGTVVVSATRTEQMIEDVPNVMEVVTAEDIERIGASTAREALNLATGVTVDAQKGGINIRGLGFSQTVLLINGRKPTILENVKDAASRILASIPVNSIERIEVLRGQAGAMYGSSAMGGIVNIITKESDEKSYSFGINGGTKHLTTSAYLDAGKIGNFNFSLAAQYKRSIPTTEDSLTYPDAYSETMSGNETMFNVDLGYGFSDDHRIKTNILYDWTKGTTFSKVGSVDKATGEIIYTDRTSYTDREMLIGSIVYDGNVGDHSYSVGTMYSLMMSDTIDRDTGRRTKTDNYSSFTVDFKDTWFLNDWNTITIGGDFTQDYTNVVDTNNKLNHYALYLQDELSFFDERLYIVPSLRYDYYPDMDFGGALTWKIGATYEYIDNHRIKANVGTGFTPPTLAYLYDAEGTGGGVTLPNSSLTPQESIGYEIRLEGDFDLLNLNYAVGYYYNEITDMISSQLTTTNQTELDKWGYTYSPSETTYSRRYNSPGTSIFKGFETELGFSFFDNFKFTGSYEYVDARNADGSRVTFTGEQIYGARLSYYNPEWDFSADLWGKYNVDFYRSATWEYDFFNVHFAMAKTFSDNLTFNVALYNLFTTERTTITDEAVAPFEWRVGFEYKF